MSQTLIKHGDEYAKTYTDAGAIEHCEYMVSSADDVESLPGLTGCAAGSVAYLADMTSMWMLGQDDAWHKMGG